MIELVEAGPHGFFGHAGGNVPADPQPFRMSELRDHGDERGLMEL